MRALATSFVLAAALAVAGCGSDQGDGAAAEPAGAEANQAAEKPAAQKQAAEAPKPDRKAPAEPGTEVKLASSQFGEILFDGEDQAIYLFDKETSSEPACYGECAAAWPPVLTEGEPRAGAGADQKLLGTTKRDDGSTQVTYNGHPLYYYAHEGPNEVLCHNVVEFGGTWLVLDAAGNAVA
jgi:predicted lipoprotein with Yx(FWY)xxD motif